MDGHIEQQRTFHHITETAKMRRQKKARPDVADASNLSGFNQVAQRADTGVIPPVLHDRMALAGAFR
ncbi:hypothetical protein D3C74_493690 [compost metagenome]